jgi:uroporphyrinogen-III synthase
MNVTRVIVTGEHEGLPKFSEGKPLEWKELPVLDFQRLPIAGDLLQKIENEPFEWIVFSSPRSVRFWSETLLEHGMDFPIETQVACVGEETADAAGWDGFTADFYPTEAGSEKFVEEFRELVSNNSVKPTVFIPMAEEGRPFLREKLTEMGCPVTAVPLYRTLLKENVQEHFSQQEFASYHALLFTSPSSIDAFLKNYSLPTHLKIIAIGQFTAAYLKKKGIECRVLPEGGRFETIAEVLC